MSLLKNLHLINLEGVECGHLMIFYSKPKFWQIGPKTKISWVYLKFCSWVNIWKCLQRIWHHFSNIVYLKCNSHTKQFEGSKCKYNNKSILKFKSKFEKMFIQYSALGRSVSKFTFWLNWHFSYYESDV